MGGQTEFLDAVRELERLAQTNNNHLDMNEIRGYFADMDLKDEQLDYICRYLESHRIFIENRVSRGQTEIADEEVTTKEDPLDADMVNIYMEEIGKASQISEEQEEMLVRKLLNGDENARTPADRGESGLRHRPCQRVYGTGPSVKRSDPGVQYRPDDRSQ